MDRRIRRLAEPVAAKPTVGRAPVSPDRAAILALQRHAGNAAVAAVLASRAPSTGRAPPPAAPPAPPPPRTDRERARAAVQRWVDRHVQRGGAADGAGGVVPGLVTVSVGKVGLVDQDLKPVDGRPDGLRLREQPTTEGNTPIGVLPHNQQVYVESEAAGGWYHVVATDGRSGWVAKQHVITDDKMPDPGSKLHRIQPGETAFDIVGKHYGQSSFVAGSDARFYCNVLVYANEERNRPGIRVPTPDEKLHLMKTMGVGKYLEAWTTAGLQIWVPSKVWADTLKGKVSAGSLSRDMWEKAKSMLASAGEFLVKIPAFVGGLIVGVGESLVDAVVGLVELVKKIVTGEIVSDIKALIDILGDEKKRAELANHLKGEFLAKWNHGNPIKKWYWRGWIFGYVIGEILATVLTAAAGAALKGTKIAAKAAKLGAQFTSAVKKLGPVAKATAVAAKVAASGPARKVMSTVAKVRGWGASILEGLGDIWSGVKTRIDDALKARRLAAVAQMTARMAAKYGFPLEKLAHIVAIAEKYNLRIWLRKGNPASLAQLRKGAIPKPSVLKAKSITPEDLYLNPKLTKADLGLTGYFNPQLPAKKPLGMSQKKWNKILDRHAQRQREFLDQSEIMDVLGKKADDPARLGYPHALDSDVRVRVDNGVVKIIEVETGAVRNVAGDIDILHILNADGSIPKRGGHIDDVLLEADLTEHGPHLWWKPKNATDRAIDKNVLESHLGGGLLEIGPEGLREVAGKDVPGFLARLKEASRLLAED